MLRAFSPLERAPSAPRALPWAVIYHTQGVALGCYATGFQPVGTRANGALDFMLRLSERPQYLVRRYRRLDPPVYGVGNGANRPKRRCHAVADA